MSKTILTIILFLFTLQNKTFHGVVTAVQDGDTLEVTIDGKVVVVRLNGIDCPEDGQGFSAKAKQFTTAFCLNKKVRIEKETIDVRGRMIATVFSEDGRNLEHELLTSGYAWHYKQYSKDPKLAELENEARKKKKGLWIDDNPMPPWEFKEAKKKKEK